MDYSVDPAAPTLWGTIDLSAAGGSLTDVLVCEGNFYVSQSAATKTDPGSVLQFPVATGTSGTISATPLKTFTVGALPDMIEANSDCTKIAVANEGEGSFSSTTNVLTDPSGSVSIITLSDGSVKTVMFESVVTSFTDAALLALGVHLPLPEAARTHFSKLHMTVHFVPQFETIVTRDVCVCERFGPGHADVLARHELGTRVPGVVGGR